MSSRPKVVDRAADEVLHLSLVGDVAADGGHRVAVLGREGVQSLAEPAFVRVADDDLGTLLEAAAGRCLADAGAGRGRDHDDLAVEQRVACWIAGNAHPRASRGRPSVRSAMMLRWISSEPP